MKLRTLIVIQAVLLAALVIGNAFVGSMKNKRQAVDLPAYGQIADFNLLDTEGRAFNRDRLQGKAWVTNFIFTRCPNQCPTMSMQFKLLAKNMPKSTGLLSFSVDPEYDKPEILARYASSYREGGVEWYYLTGTKGEIDKVVRSCHLGVEDDPNMHSLRYVLIDGTGMVRGYYDSTDPDVLQKIRKDLEQVV